MKEATAQLNNYRQSPRKVRVVADTVRGKKVAEAKNILNFLTKKFSLPLNKLLDSAIANAKNVNLKEENLVVKSITVDQGKILYRRMPVAHGASHPIRKRTSKIKLVLEEREPKAKKEVKKKK